MPGRQLSSSSPPVWKSEEQFNMYDAQNPYALFNLPSPPFRAGPSNRFPAFAYPAHHSSSGHGIPPRPQGEESALIPRCQNPGAAVRDLLEGATGSSRDRLHNPMGPRPPEPPFRLQNFSSAFSRPETMPGAENPTGCSKSSQSHTRKNENAKCSDISKTYQTRSKTAAAVASSQPPVMPCINRVNFHQREDTLPCSTRHSPVQQGSILQREDDPFISGGIDDRSSSLDSDLLHMDVESSGLNQPTDRGSGPSRVSDPQLLTSRRQGFRDFHLPSCSFARSATCTCNHGAGAMGGEESIDLTAYESAAPFREEAEGREGSESPIIPDVHLSGSESGVDSDVEVVRIETNRSVCTT